jgi:hypothetical protein
MKTYFSTFNDYGVFSCGCDLRRYKAEVWLHFPDLCRRTAEVSTLVRIPKSRVLARVLRFFLRVLSNDFECLA